jgi:hypothetical protein
MMKYFSPYEVMITSYVVAAVLVGVYLSLLDDISIANGQVVDMDEPPTNATEELDVKIDATEPLPLNGTLIVDITNADDIDIDAIPPEGISIVVTNTTIIVTNSPVEIQEQGVTSDTEEEEEDSTGTSGDGNNNQAEESAANDGSDGDANTDADTSDEGIDEE